MRQRTFTVFDDYIQPNSTVYTDARHNTTLGENDMLGLHVLADNPTTNGTLAVFIEQSSEGRNWLFRSTNGTSVPTTPDVTLTMSGTGDFEHKMWSDACLGVSTLGPLLSFVRLRLITASGVGLHVKVHATLRGGTIGR